MTSVKIENGETNDSPGGDGVREAAFNAIAALAGWCRISFMTGAGAAAGDDFRGVPADLSFLMPEECLSAVGAGFDALGADSNRVGEE